MPQAVLKKEFNSRDVSRLRHLITKKSGEKDTTSVGYTKQSEDHVEGDVWIEDKRTWTIHNGIRQNVTKLDEAKSQLHLPLFCPKCKKLMNHRYDKLFYIQSKHCFDCQLKFETELKGLGLWDEYETRIINSDIDSFIADFNIYIGEVMNQSNESNITEYGDIENWVGSAKKKILESQTETIKYLQSLKRK